MFPWLFETKPHNPFENSSGFLSEAADARGPTKQDEHAKNKIPKD